MMNQRVEYGFVQDEEDDFNVEAWVDGVRVGYTDCLRQGPRLLLADIVVSDKVPRPWPLLHRVLVSLIGPRSPMSMRHLGIGTELLRRLLEKSDSVGIREVWGSVMPDAIEDQPTLLAWYERHGFMVTQPDSECVPHSAKKIVRQR